MEVGRETLRCCLHGSSAGVIYLCYLHRGKTGEIQICGRHVVSSILFHIFLPVSFSSPARLK